MTLLPDTTAVPLHDRKSSMLADKMAVSTIADPDLNLEETSPTKKPPKVKAVHDLIAGGVAGSASVVVGHPFDTMKVRMQMSTSATSAASVTGCKISTLFRGIGAPLSTAAVVNAIIFASYGATNRLWDAYYHIPHDEDDDFYGVVAGSEGAILLEHANHPASKNQIAKNFVCGGIAGIIQSLVICPMEHVKCRLQIQSSSQQVYKNSLDAAHKIATQQGARGLYRGMMSTCWREGPGYGLYFVSYDLVRHRIAEMTGRDEHGFVPSFLSGGVAGCVIWSSTFPFDTIKTRIQCAPFDTPKAQLRIPAMARSIIRNEGFTGLYRGLSISLVRAFPVNACVFPVYGYVLRQLQQQEKNGQTSIYS